MAFVLDPLPGLAPALRDVALAELDAARRHLARGTADDIHEVRKSCKKLRAWLRLLRKPLGEDYALLNRLLRDAARAVAGDREATVVQQTLASLRRSPALPAARYRRLAAALHGHEHHPDEAERGAGRARAQLLLETAARYVADAALRLDLKALRKGYAAGHARAARAFCAAQREGSAEALHEWRKLAKYHGYQRALLAPLLLGGAEVDDLKALSDALGRHHDLHVLELHLADTCRTGGAALDLLRLRPLLQRSLQRQARRALRLGARLFDTPEQAGALAAPATHAGRALLRPRS